MGPLRPADHAAPLAEGLHDLRSLELVQKEAEEDAMDTVLAKWRDLRGMACSTYVGNVGICREWLDQMTCSIYAKETRSGSQRL